MSQTLAQAELLGVLPERTLLGSKPIIVNQDTDLIDFANRIAHKLNVCQVRIVCANGISAIGELRQ